MEKYNFKVKSLDEIDFLKIAKENETEDAFYVVIPENTRYRVVYAVNKSFNKWGLVKGNDGYGFRHFYAGIPDNQSIPKYVTGFYTTEVSTNPSNCGFYFSYDETSNTHHLSDYIKKFESSVAEARKSRAEEKAKIQVKVTVL